MDDLISTVFETMEDAFVSAVLGIVVSAIYAGAIKMLELTPLMKILFVGVFAMVDIIGLFATASEGLNSPLGYLIARLIGYVFAIWLLLNADLPATMAFANLIILLIAFVIRLKYE